MSMKWTMKVPSIEGWYWAKDPCGEKDFFYIYRAGECLYYRSLLSGYGPLNELEDLFAYKWYGPIPEPEAPEDE